MAARDRLQRVKAARFGDDNPVEPLREWIDESSRAVAPKPLVATLEAAPPKPRRRAKK